MSPNKRLRCGPPEREPGGGGINVSRAIRRLGGESSAIYPCGVPIGEMFKQLLDAEGVQHRPISISEVTRENLTIFETNSNQQFIFGMPGPELSESEWRQSLDPLSGASPPPDYIVASGSCPSGVPDDHYGRVAELAADLGSRLIVDTSGQPLRLAAETGVYLLKPYHILPVWCSLRCQQPLGPDSRTCSSYWPLLLSRIRGRWG